MLCHDLCGYERQLMLSSKLFAQNGKSLSLISGAKETCSTLLLRLDLEGSQFRVFGFFG
jgi:hypothetical protein